MSFKSFGMPENKTAIQNVWATPFQLLIRSLCDEISRRLCAVRDSRQESPVPGQALLGGQELIAQILY
jgi:hypothetical protein